MQGRDDIPEPVVMEILARLPAKPLARFRCVCKHWDSSFRTPHFITKHHHLNHVENSNLNLLVQRSYYGRNVSDRTDYFSTFTEREGKFEAEENIYLPFLKECTSYYPRIHGPCNGLLCLLFEGGKPMAAIWNPATREFKRIPPSTVSRPPAAKSTSFHHTGFGYDSQTNDFKFVRFVRNYLSDRDRGYDAEFIQQVDLYSLKSDSWKEIPFPDSLDKPVPNGGGFINGFYYWQTFDSDSYDVLLSFDMANETFSTLTLPLSFEPKCCKLFDFNGLLGALFCDWDEAEKALDLWVLNGTWTRHFSFESIVGIEKPVGFWKHGQIFLHTSEDELVLFDPATTEFKDDIMDPFEIQMKLLPYVENLVPINGRPEHEEQITRWEA